MTWSRYIPLSHHSHLSSKNLSPPHPPPPSRPPACRTGRSLTWLEKKKKRCSFTRFFRALSELYYPSVKLYYAWIHYHVKFRSLGDNTEAIRRLLSHFRPNYCFLNRLHLSRLLSARKTDLSAIAIGWTVIAILIGRSRCIGLQIVPRVLWLRAGRMEDWGREWEKKRRRRRKPNSSETVC